MKHPQLLSECFVIKIAQDNLATAYEKPTAPL